MVGIDIGENDDIKILELEKIGSRNYAVKFYKQTNSLSEILDSCVSAISIPSSMAIVKTISIDTGKNQRLITDEKLFDIDNTYKDEMDHFINIVSAHKNPCITIDDGIKALQLIEEMNVQR